MKYLKAPLIACALAILALFVSHYTQARTHFYPNNQAKKSDIRSKRISPDLILEIHDLTGRSLRPLLGVNCGPYPTGDLDNVDLTDEYIDIGVNMVRNHGFNGPLDMSAMYPDKRADPTLESSYDFTKSDIRFEAILNAGAMPYFRVGDGYSVVDPPNSDELKNWAQAAVHIIGHYREGLWNGYNTNFDYAEIWNEPDYVQFWPSPLTREDFYELYVQTAKALRQAYPDLKIGGPGWSSGVLVSQVAQVWVEEFIDYIKANQAPFDFMSWHLYSNDPHDYGDIAASMRSILDENGFDSTESHITEWNTHTGVSETMTDEELRITGKGAALNTAFWIELQQGAVDVSTFFRGNDTGMDLTTFFGLFMADGTPKKVAYAFKLWSEFTEYSSQLALTVVENTSGLELWALAGQNEEGTIALLISNPNDVALKYRLDYKGSTNVDLESANIRTYKVNDSTEGIEIGTKSTSKMNIEENTVQLIVITP